MSVDSDLVDVRGGFRGVSVVSGGGEKGRPVSGTVSRCSFLSAQMQRWP